MFVRTRAWRSAVRALSVVLALGAAPSLAESFSPFDEASQDESLVAYRDGLRKAVAARDFARLEGLLAPDIELSFGGDRGLGRAREMFRDEPALWDALARVLHGGGGFLQGRDGGSPIFIAPYTFFAESEDGLDPFEFVVATAAGTPIRAGPSASAPVRAWVDYEILPLDTSTNMVPGWWAVTLPDGESGYVEARLAVSPVDYRAGVQETDGQWRMIFFLAGD